MQNVHLTQCTVVVDCHSWKIINFRVVTRALFYVAPDRTALSVIYFYFFSNSTAFNILSRSLLNVYTRLFKHNEDILFVLKWNSD